MRTNYTKLILLVSLCACAGTKSGKNNGDAASYIEKVKGIPITMIKIQGGTFTMGQDDPNIGGPNFTKYEGPAHKVELSPYYLAETEVTQKLYKAVMGENPSYFESCEDCPVENVSWEKAQEFITKLNEITGKKYSLPTEAQWEFAASSGGKHKLYAGTEKTEELEKYAWIKSNSDYTTHPVKQKQANELGLFDMSGNAHEWCSDWYDASYYANCSPKNPEGAAEGKLKIHRGGGWGDDANACRVAFRSESDPSIGNYLVGFRLACPIE